MCNEMYVRRLRQMRKSHRNIHDIACCVIPLQSCEICQEQFETYWVEEEEDWFLKNAIRVDDKVRRPTVQPLTHFKIIIM